MYLPRLIKFCQGKKPKISHYRLKVKSILIMDQLSQELKVQLPKYHTQILEISVGIVFVLELELYWNCCFGFVYCIGIGIGHKRSVLFICAFIQLVFLTFIIIYINLTELGNLSFHWENIWNQMVHLSTHLVYIRSS